MAFNSCPARPTKGSPCRSSSAPGASPTNSHDARRLPTPNTVCVRVVCSRHAAHSLLKTEAPLSKLRGQRLSYQGTPLIVTYHPAYLLRNPADKRRTWDDLCLARAVAEAT